MLLATFFPKLIGFRACIPRTLSATLSSSSSDSTTSLNETSLRSLTLDEALKLTDPSRNVHAAHCLLYYKTVDDDVEGMFGLCQVRFDGQLGFPGGIIEPEELDSVSAIVAGLQRELKEEINFAVKASESDPDGSNGFSHISTYIDDSLNQPGTSSPRVNIYHFFMKQISEQEFKHCEVTHSQSIHFPSESLGIFRIPLIDPSNCRDKTIFRYYKKRGSFLVNFFKHYFAGIGKNQLYDSLVYLDCLTPDYLAQLEPYIRKCI
ncbi:U8 snoRNA-decapping enzyme [Tetranychus urticae]|uniref:Nudix hydrolase domain-containing protein n=1 Tax=Tetranychus urticae TaxID=32264 RepID=T1KFS1_TETUR|nr:U8 snoRNA-decapping enzyme [Tetranychus urticae]